MKKVQKAPANYSAALASMDAPCIASCDNGAPHDNQLGRFPERGRGLDRSGERARLCNPRQPQYPQRAGRAAVQPAPSALGVRLPAQVRGLPKPDRALGEDPALLGAEGPTLRALGRDRASRRTRPRLLERAQT